MDEAQNEYTGTTEKEAVRRACQELLVEPRALDYEVVEFREGLTRRNRRFSKPSYCRIRVNGVRSWEALEAEIPQAEEGEGAAPRRRDEGRGSETRGGDARGGDARGGRERRERRPRGGERGSGHGGRREDGGRERERIPADPSRGPSPENLPADPWARAQMAAADILELMGVAADVRAEETAESYLLDLRPRDAESLALLEAGVLASLQYLVARIAGGPQLEKQILLDAGGTRQARETAMAEMAARLGQKVTDLGTPVAVYPLSSLDRRAVHQALSETKGVETESQGSGAFRRLVISPAGARG